VVSSPVKLKCRRRVNVRPFEAVAGSLDSPVQFLFEDESEKAAKHVAANRLISLVKHRAGLKEGLCRAKNMLNKPIPMPL
jgi:hypothetical protein